MPAVANEYSQLQGCPRIYPAANVNFAAKVNFAFGSYIERNLHVSSKYIIYHQNGRTIYIRQTKPLKEDSDLRPCLQWLIK